MCLVICLLACPLIACPLLPYRLFRAAARLVVVFYTRPALAVKQRKLRTRDRDRQDWASTLTLYQVDTIL
jgi:hypothetical protein